MESPRYEYGGEQLSLQVNLTVFHIREVYAFTDGIVFSIPFIILLGLIVKML